MILIYIGIFFLGASFASYINATIYRLDKEYDIRKLLTLPSHCEKCKKELTWIELIPILGYFINKGRCSKCHTKVDIIYPISELILGTTFLLLYIYNIPIYIWIQILFLFFLSMEDIKHMGISRYMTHILLVYSLAIFMLFSPTLTNILVPLSVSLALILVNLIKKSFGFGDIIVLFAIGILLSPNHYILMFNLAIFLALISAIAIIKRKKIGIKEAKISMIPFISISYIITILMGNILWDTLLLYLYI